MFFIMLTFFSTNAHCWLTFILVSTSSFSAFQAVIPKPVLGHGVIPPQVQDLSFPFAELISVCFTTLSYPQWIAAQLCGASATPSFVSSANLLRTYSVPTSRLLVKMLKNIGICFDPWSALLFFWLFFHGFVLFYSQGSQHMKNINTNHLWGTTKEWHTVVPGILNRQKLSSGRPNLVCLFLLWCRPLHTLIQFIAFLQLEWYKHLKLYFYLKNLRLRSIWNLGMVL